MEINVNKTLKNNPTIQGNAGFTFIMDDDSVGFGFIFSDLQSKSIITVIKMYMNGGTEKFSKVIGETCFDHPDATINDFLELYLKNKVVFLKAYKNLIDIPITVNIE